MRNVGKIRVFLRKSQTESITPLFSIIYSPNRFYKVPTKVARKWILGGVAETEETFVAKAHLASKPLEQEALEAPLVEDSE